MGREQLIEAIGNRLTPDLLSSKWNGRIKNQLSGHCYVASEAFYHLAGGKQAGYRPYFVRHEGGSHWWVEHEDGTVIDITAAQFWTPIPYEDGVGKGFLTRQPSKRAAELIRRVRSVFVRGSEF